ncbi:NTP transferase domain-containing protein [Microbacterium sp. Mu-80]|uniref:NTP transferase domain-containing protein n=1 Tax=Microbacterium bandirmense TaxID=3122050 RepID=A0ABU8LDQ2_9MICO
MTGAILLVGGRSRRMGGGFKPLIEVGGRSLFARTLAAVSDARCSPIIAAGPVLDAQAPVQWAREHPPFTGPVAGIAAALQALTRGEEPEWVLLLAGDLPRVAQVVERLDAAIRASDSGDGSSDAVGDSGDAATDAADAVVFRADGHPQWLAGAYRTAALRSSLDALGDAVTDASCRSLLGGLEISWLSDDDGITADIDTPADLARTRAELEEES